MKREQVDVLYLAGVEQQLFHLLFAFAENFLSLVIATIVNWFEYGF